MLEKIIVLSSASALSSFRGHSYNYHRAVRDSLKLASIGYKVLIPKKNPIIDKDDLWEARMQIPAGSVSDTSSKFLRFFIYIHKSLCATASWPHFYSKFSKNTKVIVFYETGGNFLNEALISIALKILGKKPYAVWFLIRGLPDTKKFLYLLKISVFFAELFSGRGKLILATDTVLLQEHLSCILKKNVISLPIPHGYPMSCDHEASKRCGVDRVKIWGLSCTGENKGEQYLANLLRNANRTFGDIFVRSMFLEKYRIPEKPYIKVAPNELDAQQFSYLLQSCNVVLLPYFGGGVQAYKLSSSGVFVDSVTAGLLPLVTKHTWMEFELNRFNLNELVIDWGKFKTFSDLCLLIDRLLNDENTMRKLDEMRYSYANMHSPSSFLETLYRHNFLPPNDFEKIQKNMDKS